MIRSPELRAAMQVLAADRKSRRAAREPREKKAAKVAHVNLKADRGRVRDNGYLAFLRRQPCVIGEKYGQVACCDGPTQAAHIRYGKPGELPTGMQRKPNDDRCTPLCAHHHAQQHASGERWWWQHWGLDPFAVAERLFAAYEAQR